MTPTYQTTKSAGADIAASEDVVIKPGRIKLVPTGVYLTEENKDGVGAFLLFARSSLAYRKGLILANGVGLIDVDYDGEVKVMLLNSSNLTKTISKGERIAQLVGVHIEALPLVNGFASEENDRTGGFGSTGRSS